MVVNPEEIDDDIIILDTRKRTKEERAEEDRIFHERLALRRSLRAQGYTEEEIKARFDALFGHELEGIEQMTPTQYLRRVDELRAKGYSYQKACEIIDSRHTSKAAPPKKARLPKPPAAPSVKRRNRRDSAVLTA